MKASWPMRVALLVTAGVWGCGCWWSFTEQRAFAESRGFADPHLLPLIIDGFAVAVALVAYAASLDGRPAIGARLGTLLAVAGSAASNATWAWTRTDGEEASVAISLGAPLVSAIAFEVILGELRRQTMRRRGEKPPVKVPYPRVIRLVLNPLTFFPWRRLVLELTDPAREVKFHNVQLGRSDFVDNINEVSRPEAFDNVQGFPVPAAPETTAPAVPRSISIRAADDFPVRSRRTPVRSLERPRLHRDFTETFPRRRPDPATPDTTPVRPLALLDPATMAPFAWPLDDDTAPTGSTPAPLSLDRESTESPTESDPLDRESDRESTESRTETARLYWDNQREQGRTPTGADLDRIAGFHNYGRTLRRKWLAEEQATESPTESDPGHSRSTESPPRADRESTESRPRALPVPLSTNGHHQP